MVAHYPSSPRHISGKGNASHDASTAGVVVDREVLHAAVIPNSHCPHDIGNTSDERHGRFTSRE